MHYYLHFYFIVASTLLFGENPLLQRANENYQKGLKASTWQERLTSFNDALLLYTEIENSDGPAPQINKELGDLYFELTEYPWAILYYERNLKQAPDDLYTLNHLNAVQKKLGLKLTTLKERPLWRVALLDSLISQSTRLKLFFLGSVVTIALAAFSIWSPKPIIKKGLFLFWGLSALILLNYFILFYLTPIEGIMVTASGLYRDANPNASQVVPSPILAGEKVRVIDTKIEGFWLKVINTDGQLGYVRVASIRII